MTWYSDFIPICEPDAPLAPLTWYELGGPARWLFTPTSAAQLAALVRCCRDAAIPWRVLGHGANVLIRDAGFDGAVIRLSAPAFAAIDWADTSVTVGAGYDFTKLCKQACQRALAGLEGLAGIPGTVGGLVRMNAGGKYGQIGDAVSAVEFVTSTGDLQTRPRDQLEFAYRRSNLADGIVTAATFALTPADQASLMAEYRRIWQEKHAAQPAVAARSAGCIFKNPPGAAAGALLDQAGLKGARVGRAEISDRHANFIVAHPGATAQDILELISQAKERVRAAHGVELELEVEIW